MDPGYQRKLRDPFTPQLDVKYKDMASQKEEEGDHSRLHRFRPQHHRRMTEREQRIMDMAQ